ncbi:AsmA family protein [Aliiruegeria lutimaris]|uniref:AsmA family protein n=1 Tax=Aliiruegeria lutimaris TaxID=571298 RepID=A0A1G9GI33_9RHOB|nr:AsmA family protein [Aliiruegeria lutimaris]SDL00262.1 AsmA family protein [Aliiruegeria lutimaris]
MKKFLLWTIGSLLGVVVLAALGVWLLLALPLFSDLRRSITEDILSEQIGQPLHIQEDVRVVLGPVSRITVAGVEIPSQSIEGTALAELNRLEMDLDLVALSRGEFHFDDLLVDGVQANLLTDADGTTSWRDAPPETKDEVEDPDQAQSETGGEGILVFLKDKNVEFTSIGLTVDNAVSGFSFVFDLENLSLSQDTGGARTVLNGLGTVNGQTFEVEGDFPHDAAFTTRAAFGDLTADFNGAPFSPDEGGGFSGDLALETGAFGDFLEMLGLERSLEGNGSLQARLVSQRGLLGIEDFAAIVTLEGGQELTANGSAENLLETKGLGVTFDAQLFPQDKQPPRAKTFGDLKLTGIDMHVVSTDSGLEFENLAFHTNLFDQGLERVGPITIEHLRKLPDGRLAMQGMTLQAGPLEEPYLLAEGEILDLLKLGDLSFEGTLTGPAKLILADLGEEVAGAFGGIEAGFEFSDESGALALNRFEATNYGTDIWTLDLHLLVDDLTALGGLDFDVDFDVLDGETFLSALNLEPVPVGALGVAASTRKQGDDFTASVSFTAGGSDLAAKLDATFPEGAPVVRGTIESDRVNLGDLQNLSASLAQLQVLFDSDKREDDPDVKPLVLPKEEPEVKPLVLPKEQAKPSDLLNPEELLTKADVEVLIDSREISGQQGVSAVSSTLSSKEGKLRFGPLDLAYGGWHFSLTAAMDMVNAPDRIALSGATSGWDFGEILDSLGLGIDAHGTLRGDFDITSNLKSSSFVNSMRGRASISMANGNISTSLLELAGLGVFPWLFSRELQQGYTDITCIVAPVRIEAGKASTNSIVVETGSVQLVGKGTVDWVNDAISLRAEPRRVGKPLSRSAWPFDVTGKLSAPEFKLDVGGSRSRRADGADQMPANRKPCVPDMHQLE